MQKIFIEGCALKPSRIALGCMNLAGHWNEEENASSLEKRAETALLTALDCGINLFDHADIYQGGESEEMFAKLWQWRPGCRDEIYIQSKCTVRFPGSPPGSHFQRYDASYDHIIESVEGTLARLETDYLDVLLLHQPDPLMEPGEIARAFDRLEESGKVRYFGVSNHHALQIQLIQKYCRQNLLFNQVQLSLLHHALINEGVMFNQNNRNCFGDTLGTLEYCRLQDIILQAWSPLMGGKLNRALEDEAQSQNIRETARLTQKMAEEKDCTMETIAAAWLLRHPGPIIPVIGSRTPERIKAAAAADEINLSREEWYQLFQSARGCPLI